MSGTVYLGTWCQRTYPVHTWAIDIGWACLYQSGYITRWERIA